MLLLEWMFQYTHTKTTAQKWLTGYAPYDSLFYVLLLWIVINHSKNQKGDVIHRTILSDCRLSAHETGSIKKENEPFHMSRRMGKLAGSSKKSRQIEWSKYLLYLLQIWIFTCFFDEVFQVLFRFPSALPPRGKKSCQVNQSNEWLA